MKYKRLLEVLNSVYYDDLSVEERDEVDVLIGVGPGSYQSVSSFKVADEDRGDGKSYMCLEFNGITSEVPA